jgi:FkbM family methyltransferase
MERTSELVFTNVDVSVPKVSQDYYMDTHTEFYNDELQYISYTKTRYSDKFFYYTNDIIIGHSLRHYGEYTENEVQVLRQFMQPGFVVYDIGANIGYHTLGLAERAKMVYAFEPNKKNYKLLQKNTQYKTNIKLFPCAVSNSVGSVTISDFNLDTQGNYGEVSVSDTGYSVPATTIDTLLNDLAILPPQLVKIDVEGYEWNVIQGMKQTIEKHLPIIFYEHLHGDDLPKVHEYLETLKYKFYWFPCMNYNQNNYKNNKQNIFGVGGVMNVLAVPHFIQLNGNLIPKLSSTESWQDAVERIQNAK